MATVDFTSLARPVSDAEPCGPDLELAGDANYMNFVARAEGLLPTSFFVRDDEGRQTPFDRSALDIDAQVTQIANLLATTRDLRLLSLLAKFLIINRDLAGFTGAMDCIAKLLEERWDEVHPRGEGSDFSFRTVALQSLDDPPTVVFPLQYTPLLTSRRFGPITYRNYAVATGEAKPREDEGGPDLAVVHAAVTEADLAGLITTRDQLKALQGAVQRIRAVTIDRAGVEQAVNLESLTPVVGRMLAAAESTVVRRDPSAALPGAATADAEAGAAQATGAAGATPSAIQPGAVASVAAAREALEAVTCYFDRVEPSNPAVLLVRQAQQLVGKSFVEVMRILMPAEAEQAIIQVGGEQSLRLSFEHLSALASAGQPRQVNGLDDEPSAGLEAAGGPAANGAGERRLEARTRPDALALLEQVGAFYRITEPSSPIPLLTGRARELAGRDFLSLLKDVLANTRAAQGED
jgi:type VI secretion system protein ImpA